MSHSNKKKNSKWNFNVRMTTKINILFIYNILFILLYFFFLQMLTMFNKEPICLAFFIFSSWNPKSFEVAMKDPGRALLTCHWWTTHCCAPGSPAWSWRWSLQCARYCGSLPSTRTRPLEGALSHQETTLRGRSTYTEDVTAHEIG